MIAAATSRGEESSVSPPSGVPTRPRGAASALRDPRAPCTDPTRRLQPPGKPLKPLNPLRPPPAPPPDVKPPSPDRGIPPIPANPMPIARRQLAQPQRQQPVLRRGLIQLALHRRQMLIHRRHDQLRARRRATQRRGRSTHRAGLSTNQTRPRPALSAHRPAVGDLLPRPLIMTVRTNLGLLVDATSTRRTTSQTAVPTRDGRHRAPTRTGGKHLSTLTGPPSRKQPMTTSQQPINPSHELRNTHPPKLT